MTADADLSSRSFQDSIASKARIGGEPWSRKCIIRQLRGFRDSEAATMALGRDLDAGKGKALDPQRDFDGALS